jgi:hypothetical protein
LKSAIAHSTSHIAHGLRAIVLCLLFSCEPQLTDEPIPLVTFVDQVCNLGFPEFSSLRVDGGYKEFNKIGVRGVIVYRVSPTTFRAYERNCSYHPNEAGATVNIHSSGLFLEDSSCGSSFNFSDGQPSGGPAWRPLRQYHTDITGNVLTITADVIN